jgi:hypothetical protein
MTFLAMLSSFCMTPQDQRLNLHKTSQESARNRPGHHGSLLEIRHADTDSARYHQNQVEHGTLDSATSVLLSQLCLAHPSRLVSVSSSYPDDDYTILYKNMTKYLYTNPNWLTYPNREFTPNQEEYLLTNLSV